MRSFLAVWLCLFLAGCEPWSGTSPQQWSGDELESPEAPEAPEWTPMPGPAEAADQDLEAKVAGAPELSGRFWAGDLVCLPPGGSLRLRPLAAGAALALADAAAWKQAGGNVRENTDGSLELSAPRLAGTRGGLNLTGGKAAHFNLIVLHEAAVEANPRGGWRVRVGGEVIGNYPDPAASPSRLVREHAALYRPPRFFLKIEASTLGLQLAPHLLAGQMVSLTGPKGQPKRRHTAWSAPNRPLVEKLERLSRELAEQNLKFRRLTVNSGFRTPAYNARVGGGAYSRHLYGDAADVMIDENGDERMDDLNRDRVINERDALIIAEAARKLELAGRVKPGGIGVYSFDTADSVGAFVHLDARGFVTRWGTAHRRGRALDLPWWPPEEFKQDEDSE